MASKSNVVSIYKVPNCLRHVNSEAYTPQRVLIGPLHYSKKNEAQAARDRGESPNERLVGYSKMEEHKKRYQEAFEKRFIEKDTIDCFKKAMVNDIQKIKDCYSESTDWIPQEDFMEMIMKDSIFILELILRRSEVNIEDPLMTEPCLGEIKRDLMLLENQLPYFILERLFDLVIKGSSQMKTLQDLVVTFFGFQDQTKHDTTFSHFTDLFRYVRVQTLSQAHRAPGFNTIQHMYNANKLESGGVKFTAERGEPSLVVSFVNGCLKIPSFSVEGNTEVQLRNIMALEQCHYPSEGYVCNHIIFLDHLISTEKDVDLLVKKGIIKNRIGNHDTVAEIVNKLCSGVVEIGSYYSGIATRVNDHYVENEKMRIALELGRCPGMWRPTHENVQQCCIYRVPGCLRRANPEAYTPQLVLIGPLHHYLKAQALKAHGDITNAKSMGYLNMEAQKKIYKAKFVGRVHEENIIERYRGLIKENIERIRGSYSELTVWIQQEDFVEMILEDAVFILEFLWRTSEVGLPRSWDPLMDEPCLEYTIKRDLILLENQLPYFILETLFDSIENPIHRRDQTFRAFVTTYFKVGQIGEDYIIQHFTDLFRRARVETLPQQDRVMSFEPLEHMYSADKLENGGVKLLKADMVQDMSLVVNFANGCLSIPRFSVGGETEVTLRNIMALEQCHYPRRAYVCNYIIFLDYLIDSEKDVDLLVEKGIIRNRIGHNRLVAEIVNKLCAGVVEFGSYYSPIAKQVTDLYDHHINSSCFKLKRVYFTNRWRGTATFAASAVLLMTLGQLITAIYEAAK